MKLKVWKFNPNSPAGSSPLHSFYLVPPHCILSTMTTHPTTTNPSISVGLATMMTSLRPPTPIHLPTNILTKVDQVSTAQSFTQWFFQQILYHAMPYGTVYENGAC